MKYAAVILALATSVFSQSLADLPPCSIPCLTSAVSSGGCGVTDYACQCGANRDSIVASVTPCLTSSCNAEEQATVLSITNEICASLGGAASVTSAIGSATSAIGSVSSAISSATESAAAGNGAVQQHIGAAGALIAAAGLFVL